MGLKEGKYYRNFWISHNRQKISQHEFQPGTFDGRPGIQQLIRNYAGDVRENKIMTGLSYDNATNSVSSGVCIIDGVIQDIAGVASVINGSGDHVLYNTLTSQFEKQDPPFTGLYIASGNGETKWREQVNNTGVHVGYHSERSYKGEMHDLTVHSGTFTNAAITNVRSNVNFNNNYLDGVNAIGNPSAPGGTVNVWDSLDLQNQSQLNNVGSIDGGFGALSIENIEIDGGDIDNVTSISVGAIDNNASDININDNIDIGNNQIKNSKVLVYLNGAANGSIYGGNGTTADTDAKPPVGVGVGTDLVQIAGPLSSTDWGGTIAGTAGNVAYVTAVNTIGDIIGDVNTHVKVIGVFTSATEILVNPSPIVLTKRV